MKVLVAYESRGGRTKAAAEAIAEAARAQGADVDVRSTMEAGPEDVKAADVLFAGAWVEGFILFGVGPARAMRRWMEGLPGLEGKRAAVFCTYAFHPRKTLDIMEANLRAKDARVVGRLAAHRRDPGQGTQQLVQSVLTEGET